VSALLLPNEILSMSAQAARRLVEAGEGDCALLYLALLESGEPQKAGRALHWGQEKLSAVYARLAELELVAAERTPAPENEPEKLPQYSREDLLHALEGEPDFCALYREVERLLGRTFSDADLQSLYTVYDGMALPAEVILLLVSYMIRTVRRQSGKPGAMPRMIQIRTEASRWKRMGLDTVEAAEEHLRRQELVDRREGEILTIAGIRENRAARERERKYITQWVELGLSNDMIALACDRTVTQKGQMNWSYANQILNSWHRSGWQTREQVEAGDKPASRRTAGRKQPDYQPSAQRIQQNSDWLDEFLKTQGKGE